MKMELFPPVPLASWQDTKQTCIGSAGREVISFGFWFGDDPRGRVLELYESAYRPGLAGRLGSRAAGQPGGITDPHLRRHQEPIGGSSHTSDR
jgi:hypothetical protein